MCVNYHYLIFYVVRTMNILTIPSMYIVFFLLLHIKHSFLYHNVIWRYFYIMFSNAYCYIGICLLIPKLNCLYYSLIWTTIKYVVNNIFFVQLNLFLELFWRIAVNPRIFVWIIEKHSKYKKCKHYTFIRKYLQLKGVVILFRHGC